MSTPIDLTDVPTVSEFELARPMKLLVEKERALCLLKGASLEDRRMIEEAFWDAYHGPTVRGVTIMLRFWCLVEAFSAKRFKALLLHRGFQAIGPAVAAASKLRLNASWGFNPQRLLWSIQGELDKKVQPAVSKASSVVHVYKAQALMDSQAA